VLAANWLVAKVPVREVSITKHLQGAAGVVKLISVDEDEHNVYLVLERCYVRSCPGRADTPRQRKAYIRDTLEAIKSVQDRGIVHAEVKPDNFMLVDDPSYDHAASGGKLDGKRVFVAAFVGCTYHCG
jgi:serine/threonine protein kinase